jgi:serine/threonine protein kinase
MSDTIHSGIDAYINICFGREYILTRKIGKGSFGEIYLAISKITHMQVAVKFVKLSERFRRE